MPANGSGRTFPGPKWDRADPAKLGFDPDRLEDARAELEDVAVDSAADPRGPSAREQNAYRVIVVRNGHIVAEWNNEIAPEDRRGIASASKSVFSCILAIAVAEGKIASADVKLESLFPEALDVLPGEGPKEGRHARAKDREITLRQLIANTSGYLKPDEPPGTVKHYQTYGMNVLTHAIASAYNLYDPSDPERRPGYELLMDTRLRIPMRGSWGYAANNFEYPDGARSGHFGFFRTLRASARDMARLGWLWANYGFWEGEQLVPEAWMREAVEVVPAEREADPDRNMLETYGLGFWTNAEGARWPSLPTDSFAALGAGGHVIWACPSRELVVVEGPGPFYRDAIDEYLLPTVLASLV